MGGHAGRIGDDAKGRPIPPPRDGPGAAPQSRVQPAAPGSIDKAATTCISRRPTLWSMRFAMWCRWSADDRRQTGPFTNLASPQTSTDHRPATDGHGHPRITDHSRTDTDTHRSQISHRRTRTSRDQSATNERWRPKSGALSRSASCYGVPEVRAADGDSQGSGQQNDEPAPHVDWMYTTIAPEIVNDGDEDEQVGPGPYPRRTRDCVTAWSSLTRSTSWLRVHHPHFRDGNASCSRLGARGRRQAIDDERGVTCALGKSSVRKCPLIGVPADV
jgi:hypothetical protein